MSGEYRIGFSTESQRLIEAAWAKAPQIVERELRGFMEAATLALKGEAQDKTPTNRGTLRASIGSGVRVIENGLGVEGIVGTSLNYALPVELGTKPHWVPLDALVDWVKRKGLAVVAPYVRGTPRAKRRKLAERREREVLRVARAIRFSIARKGTSQWQRERHGDPGALMFRETFDQARAGLVRDFDALARRVAQQLGAA